jgi:hypothetical protein
MTEHKILINRTLNCIETLKHFLGDGEESILFNDLLILRHIVPTLPKEAIRELLHELKPHTAPPLVPDVDFEKIMRVLVKVERPSTLLTDFLACAGLTHQEKS